MIEKYKSGFLPPEDIPFEDLSTAESGSGNSSTTTPQNTPSEKKTSILGTITGGNFKKRSGLLGIFGQNKVSNSAVILGQELCSQTWSLYLKVSSELKNISH